MVGTETPVQVLRDIVYGHARVDCADGRPGRLRALRLDRYAPADGAGAPRPVAVLAFGGAFHRGSKEDDAFETPEARNTAVAHYCQLLAQRGFVACSIDYRLVQEDPDPGSTRAVAAPERIPRSRVDVVRALLGLPPASGEALWRGIEAASDDMAMAARFVLAQAGAWHLDTRRLVLGGFSAGARTALNAVFAEGVPAAAVVSLSGYMDAQDQQRHLAACQRSPAVLLVSAEHDLDYVAAHQPAMAEGFRRHGLACEQLRVPAAGHFYAQDARALQDDGGVTSVGAGLFAFLARRLGGAGA